MTSEEWAGAWALITSPFILFLIVLIWGAAGYVIWVERKESRNHRE